MNKCINCGREQLYVTDDWCEECLSNYEYFVDDDMDYQNLDTNNSAPLMCRPGMLF